jgi:glycine/D-amino acid oxidase-like deaminating enzyme
VSARPIEETCFWLARRPARTPRPLDGEVSVDVAIVGAGFTGLWTALSLQELAPSTSIAILEAGCVGYGASGRNAGIVGETLDHSPDLAIRHFGLEEARRMSRLGRENLDGLERFLAERGLDAGFSRPGQLTLALTAGHVEDLKRTVESAHRLGLEDWRWLSREETAAEITTPLAHGAVLAPRNALVDPVRLADSLAREAERGGARVHERTRVRAIATASGGLRVTTDFGAVHARSLVLATNAYSHHLLPGLARRFLPLYDYIVVSEPLTPEQRAALGWARGRGLTDGRAFFNYARPTADGRVLWGTSEAVYHRGNRVDVSFDDSPPHTAGLEKSFARFFPEVRGLKFTHAWGGPIASTTRLTPFFGTALGGRLHYALGYTGHGVGTTRLAGRALAHTVLGKTSPLLDLAMVRKKPLPYPPEPLRSAAVGAVTGALRRTDAGGPPGLFLKLLDALGIGFSS